MHFKTILPLAILQILSLASAASSICPGYNYAFWNGGNGWFYTSDDACEIVVRATCPNVCDCEHWGCSVFSSVDKLIVNGLWYNCRKDINPGTCGDSGNQIAHKTPETCCRNDGKRNFEQGLISKRHADAIAETNLLLERHEWEYENAERNGHDVAKLRRRQLVEVEDHMREEAEAAALGDEWGYPGE